MKVTKKKLLIYIASGIAGTALICGFVVARPAIARQMHAWKVLPEPEKLTELYFTDHLSLPTTYMPTETQTVTFTVHNLEYSSIRYAYTITQSSEDGQTAIDLKSGEFSLDHDHFQNESVAVTLGDTGPRSKISITLESGEAIHYWVNKAAS